MRRTASVTSGSGCSPYPAMNRVLELLRGAQQVVAQWRPLTTRLAAPVPAPLRPAVDDLTAQVRALVGPGFVTATGRRRLPDLRRYLAAANHRLDRLAGWGCVPLKTVIPALSRDPLCFSAAALMAALGGKQTLDSGRGPHLDRPAHGHFRCHCSPLGGG